MTPRIQSNALFSLKPYLCKDISPPLPEDQCRNWSCQEFLRAAVAYIRKSVCWQIYSGLRYLSGRWRPGDFPLEIVERPPRRSEPPPGVRVHGSLSSVPASTAERFAARIL